MDKTKAGETAVFGYRTGLSLRVQGPPSRGWITWLLLLGLVVVASALVLGVLYWLVTVDAEALLTSLRQLVSSSFSTR